MLHSPRVSSNSSLTVDTLRQASAREDLYGNVDYLLEDEETISEALAFLQELNLARFIPDEFGPDIIVRAINFRQNLEELKNRDGSVFEKFDLAGDGRNNWLSAALRAVNSHIQLMRAAQPEAFENEGAWQPIPLDRDDQQQGQAAAALDRMVEELRGDNGYAATNPEEKAFVQDKLSAVARRLKEDSQISWMYLLEFAFKPLGIIIKRFGRAAIGIAATTAKESLLSWLKGRGITFFDGVF